ncbi:hypothetical protein Tco_0389344 [Tanacetum coccineum]
MFDEIQKLFDKEMNRVNTFVAMGSEVQERKENKEEGREKQLNGEQKEDAWKERAGERSTERILKETKKVFGDKRDEDIAIVELPLVATQFPGCYKKIDREDLEALWRTMKEKYGDIRPDNEFERVLWGDLKVMFERDKMSDVWEVFTGYRVTIGS